MRLGSELALQVDLAAAAIAVLALLFSFRAGRRQRRVESETLRLQRDSDVISWSDTCLTCLCQAEMLMRPEYAAVTVGNEFEKRRFEVLADLSSGIDRGRMFFPNTHDGKLGLNKESAYQGHRHPVLDPLVWTYELLSKTSHSAPGDASERKKVRDQAIDFKRDFVSKVQSEVDPRRRITFLKSHA